VAAAYSYFNLGESSSSSDDEDYSPEDWKKVRDVCISIKFVGIHLYTWVEKGTLRVTQTQHPPKKAQIQTAQFRVECNNHEATTPEKRSY